MGQIQTAGLYMGWIQPRAWGGCSRVYSSDPSLTHMAIAVKAQDIQQEFQHRAAVRLTVNQVGQMQ